MRAVAKFVGFSKTQNAPLCHSRLKRKFGTSRHASINKASTTERTSSTGEYSHLPLELLLVVLLLVLLLAVHACRTCLYTHLGAQWTLH